MSDKKPSRQPLREIWTKSPTKRKQSPSEKQRKNEEEVPILGTPPLHRYSKRKSSSCTSTHKTETKISVYEDKPKTEPQKLVSILPSEIEIHNRSNIQVYFYTMIRHTNYVQKQKRTRRQKSPEAVVRALGEEQKLKQQAYFEEVDSFPLEEAVISPIRDPKKKEQDSYKRRKRSL